MKLFHLLSSSILMLAFLQSCSDTKFGVKRLPSQVNDNKVTEPPVLPPIPQLVAVKDLVIKNTTTTSAVLDWRPLDIPVTGYVFSYNQDESTELTCEDGTRVDGPSVEVLGLKADSKIYAIVCAIRDNEIGPDAKADGTLPAYTPVTPTNLRTTATQTTLDIQWDNPAPIANEGFKLLVSRDNKFSEKKLIDVKKDTKYIASGLEPFQNYHIFVVSYNTRGDLSAPVTGTAMTLAYDPLAPKSLVLVPQAKAIDISWTDPNPGVNKGFFLNIVEGSKQIDCNGGIDVGPKTQYLASGLTPYTVYTVSVCSYNINKTKSSSIQAQGRTLALLAATPIDFKGLGKTRSIDLSWKDASPGITQGFLLKYAPGTVTLDCQDAVDVGKKLSFEVKNLEAYKEYSFALCAYNVAKQASAPARTVVKTAAEVPVPPTDLKAKPGIDTIDVSWKNPDEKVNKGSKIQISEKEDELDCAKAKNVGKATTYQAKNLKSYTEYYIAVCSYGHDDKTSKPAIVKTKTLDEDPISPENFKAKGEDQTSISLTWENEVDPAKYLLSYKEGEEYPESCETAPSTELDGGLRQKLVEKLKANTMYSFTLCSVNYDGKISPQSFAKAKTEGEIRTITPIEVPICESLGEGNDEGEKNKGIIGKLYDSGQKAFDFQSIVANAKRNGGVIENPLYMNKLDIPTRVYDQGFVKGYNDDGSPILVMNTKKSEPLIEFFGISFKGRLTLGEIDRRPTDEEGHYQIGFISDDGVTMRVRKNEKEDWVSLIDDNVHHPTKFVCPNQTIEMKKGTKLHYELDYFQAPRQHIALVMVWRKVREIGEDKQTYTAKKEAHPFCGDQDNDMWFLSRQGSTPTAKYQRLLDSGFKVLGTENFLLPREDDINLCNDPDYVPPLRDGCFEESLRESYAKSFILSKEKIDEETLEVALDGKKLDAGSQTYSYVGNDRVVVLKRALTPEQTLKVRYCQEISK